MKEVKSKNRGKAKHERKHRVQENKRVKKINQLKKPELSQTKEIQAKSKEQLEKSLISKLDHQSKIQILSIISNEIVSAPERNYRKINDLLLLCEDNDIEVVKKSMKSLCVVFCDIMPSYKIRLITDKEEKTHVSKDVKELREYETALLDLYQHFLKICEAFLKLKTGKQVKKTQTEKEKALVREKFIDIKRCSMKCLSHLLRKLSYFNYRQNILDLVMTKIASLDVSVRRIATDTLKELLSSNDESILDFKLEAIKMLAKQLKTKAHENFEPDIIDYLLLHQIIVDEEQLKNKEGSLTKIEEMKKDLKRNRKGKKFKEYKEIKKGLIQEMKDVNALGIDLGKVSEINNKIIKEIVAIYFDILKNKMASPLLRSVFLGLPNFVSILNVDLVWNVITALRQFLSDNSEKSNYNFSNMVSAVLCSLQIINGVGESFNIEEKSFSDSIYFLLQASVAHLASTGLSEMLILIKSIMFLFVQKRQYSNELTSAFIKRMALVAMHFPTHLQAGILLLMKQIMGKYQNASHMLDPEEEGTVTIYQPDINDPQLANAGTTNILNELAYIANTTHSSEVKSLVASILRKEGLPSQFLNVSPIELVKKLC